MRPGDEPPEVIDPGEFRRVLRLETGFGEPPLRMRRVKTYTLSRAEFIHRLVEAGAAGLVLAGQWAKPGTMGTALAGFGVLYIVGSAIRDLAGVIYRRRHAR